MCLITRIFVMYSCFSMLSVTGMVCDYPSHEIVAASLTQVALGLNDTSSTRFRMENQCYAK